MKFTNELRGVKSRLLLFSVLLLIPVMMFAQSITVKGTVLDSAGEAVIGASVVEKGISARREQLLILTESLLWPCLKEKELLFLL